MLWVWEWPPEKLYGSDKGGDRAGGFCRIAEERTEETERVNGFDTAGFGI